MTPILTGFICANGVRGIAPRPTSAAPPASAWRREITYRVRMFPFSLSGFRLLLPARLFCGGLLGAFLEGKDVLDRGDDRQVSGAATEVSAQLVLDARAVGARQPPCDIV